MAKSSVTAISDISIDVFGMVEASFVLVPLYVFLTLYFH